MPVSATVLEELRAAAKAASQNAYCGYSQFPVGAALVADGMIYAGCNVENASSGLTICAERNAIGQMVAQGKRTFEAIVVYTPTQTTTAPCGACRQVLYEFNSNAEVISVCDSDEVKRATVSELLPGAFGPKNLEKA
jgi:cytidine deaminase